VYGYFGLIQLLIAAGNRIRRAMLSRREKELLGTCATSDTIRFVPYDGRLSLVIRDFGRTDKDQIIEEQEYVDAFLTLYRLEFFSGEDELFQLTPNGRITAESLSAKGFRAKRRDSLRG
jgi:hypothetical protein